MHLAAPDPLLPSDVCDALYPFCSVELELWRRTRICVEVARASARCGKSFMRTRMDIVSDNGKDQVEYVIVGRDQACPEPMRVFVRGWEVLANGGRGG